jgi:hypothetical protein
MAEAAKICALRHKEELAPVETGAIKIIPETDYLASAVVPVFLLRMPPAAARAFTLPTPISSFGTHRPEIASLILIHVMPASFVAYAIMIGNRQHQLGSTPGNDAVCIALALDVTEPRANNAPAKRKGLYIAQCLYCLNAC